MNGRGARGGRALRALALPALLSLSLALPAGVSADGDERPATAKEKDFHARVAGALAQAVPPGPAGWEEERERIEPPARVGTGAERHPFRVSHRVSWSDARRRSEADRRQMDALGAVANTPDQGLKELMARADRLAQELGAAAAKGDQAALERLGREFEELQAKMQKRTAVQDARMQEAQRATSPHDVVLRVTLAANTFSESFYEKVAPEPPAGGGLVYRAEGKPDQDGVWREGKTFVFLGKGWQLKKDGGAWMEAPRRAGAPSLAVQTVVITIEADAARARGVLAKMDWAALQRLLAN